MLINRRTRNVKLKLCFDCVAGIKATVSVALPNVRGAGYLAERYPS